MATLRTFRQYGQSTEWEVSFYFPGSDNRYNPATRVVSSSDFEAFLDEWRVALNRMASHTLAPRTADYSERIGEGLFVDVGGGGLDARLTFGATSSTGQFCSRRLSHATASAAFESLIGVPNAGALLVSEVDARYGAPVRVPQVSALQPAKRFAAVLPPEPPKWIPNLPDEIKGTVAEFMELVVFVVGAAILFVLAVVIIKYPLAMALAAAGVLGLFLLKGHRGGG